MIAAASGRIAGTRTTCPYCGVGCGLIANSDGTVVGDPDHPANFGRLCSKGAAVGETLGDDGRLLYPEIDGRAANWDDALNRIATTFQSTIERHGPDAVALYVSGQFLTEDYYVANKLMKGFIGSANIDTNSRLCMASSVAGHIRAFGEDIVPGCYDDIDRCDLAVLVGSNMAWCHPVLYRRLIDARAARGTRIVVIDPRRTPTCDEADLHLALRPGTDVALFTALLVEIATRGVANTAWIERHTSNFQTVLRQARDVAPSLESAASIADIPVEKLRIFCDWFIATERVVTLYSQGVNQSSAGTDKVNAIVNCHLATGRIGRAGMGPFSLTGQPNAMGGREVGGLANQLAAHMSFDDASDIDRVRRFWQAPRIATRPGHKAVDLFAAVHDGTIKALWIMGTNPAATMPRAGRVREALASCPFLVVSDCWATDTTQYADIVLPAAGWGEKDGTVTNSERRISRQRAFRAFPGAARPDWWVLAEVARRMGWRDAFDYPTMAAVFREHAALSAFENDGARLFDLGALAEFSDADYDAMKPVQWPVPRRLGGHGTPRLFADGAFSTTDRRARFVSTAFHPIAATTTRAFPFLLNTGRIRDQWHTMTRTGQIPRLMNHISEPLLALHPDDATTLGFAEGDFAQVGSEHGAAVFRVCLSPDQRRGEAFVPMHWTDNYASSGPINRLIGGATDPISGQPELKATPIAVTPISMRWRGFLLRHRTAPMPSGDFHWSRIPLDQGQACDLAGWAVPPEGAMSENWVRTLLAASAEAELVIYADPRRGVFRYASLLAGRLDACLFIASGNAPLPAQDELARLLGDPVSGDARSMLLAGTTGIGRPIAGATICACFQVGLEEIKRAILGQQLVTVAAIGHALRAGTNCGSCLPELTRILRETVRLDGALANSETV